MIERVIVVSPRGFCAGVVRAIETVERALATFPPPVYVRRAIVHNGHVVARLAAAGAVFVQELDEVPIGSVVVLSAHGVPAPVYEQARARGLRVIDATCPLVAKVHHEVQRFSESGYGVVLVGHAGDDEVVGTLGQAPGVHLVEPGADVSSVRVADPERVACVFQTTLSHQDTVPMVDRLRERFPRLVEPAVEDICFATRNRQAAVGWLARNADVVLIVGDATSSNTRRLLEEACAAGVAAHLIVSAAEVEESWTAGARVVGVSAGASTPEGVVGQVVDHFRRQGAEVQHEALLEERVSFRLPAELVASDIGPLTALAR